MTAPSPAGLFATGFAGRNLSNKRDRGESFKAYRQRLRENKKDLKHYLRYGKPLWISCVDELIRNPITGEVLDVIRHKVQGQRIGSFKNVAHT